MTRIVSLLTCAAMALAAGAYPRVSLLTAMPGEEVYALEGHTGLRIADADTGTDCVVNWGVYNFAAPNFVYRFVSGQTDYDCALQSTEGFIMSYNMEGRRVVEQVLDLDSVQTAKLIALIEDNLRPENRTYRYNYVKDNCATRPLELLEAATGRSLVDDAPAQSTFRNEMRRFHKNYPWYQFGIDLALGRGIDYEITRHKTAFAPVTLMKLMDDSGLVADTVAYGEHTLRVPPTPWYLTPMFFALLVLAAAIGTCFLTWQKWFDSLLFGAFFLTGCVLTFLVFISEHEATSPNLLLLWLNPFCILGVILPWIKRAKKVEMSYFFVNFALLILMTLLVPVVGRGMNPAFWPLIAADAVRSLANIHRCKKAANRS